MQNRSGIASSANPSGKVFPAIVFSAGAALFSIGSFFTLALIDGWFNFPGASKFLFPYRDYYYPVPPFTYFEAQVFSRFPLPSISLRIFYVILGSCFALSLYYLAAKFSDKRTASIVAIFCTSILSLLRLEPAGGWNTQSIMFSTIAITFCIYGWMNDSQQLKFGMLAGIFFFLSVLTKQTVLFPVAMLIIASTLIGIRRKSHSILKLIKYTVSAQIISGAILVVFLHRNSALGPFVKTMLTSGGKNLVLDDLVEKIVVGILEIILNYHSLLIGSLILLHYFQKRIKNAYYFDTAYICVLILLSVNIFSNLNEVFQISLSVILFLIYHILEKRFSNRSGTILNIIIVIICPIAIGIIKSIPNESNILTKIQGYLLANINLQEFWLTLAFFIILLFLIQNKTTEEFSRIYQVNFLIAIYVISNLVFAVLSSGGSFFLFWFIQLFIIGVPFLISNLRKFAIPNFKLTFALLMSLLLFTTISLVGKALHNPYSWWGWNEPSVFHENRILVGSGYYKGLPVTQEQHTLIKLIASFETKAALLSPIRPTTLFSFSNIPMTQSITPIANYSELNCTIVWFDLCPDELVKKDLQKFKVNPPSVIVWSQPTEDAFFVHEKLFTKQRSALRDWDVYRLSQIENGSWKLVGTIPPSSMNWWPIQIYAVMQK